MIEFRCCGITNGVMKNMRVFEITKEYEKAFENFIPKYVLAQIGAPGFHTIGEVATDGSDHYAAGLLQKL